MGKPYTYAWATLLVATLASVWGACFVFQWATSLNRDIGSVAAENKSTQQTNAKLARDLQNNQEAAARVTKFLQAWEPHINPLAEKKDRQMAILNLLEEEAVALQDLQVNRKVTPSIKKYHFGDQTIDVEQVQMVVAGPVNKALVYLGRAEEIFPYARIKQWTLRPMENGRSIELEFSLVQPVRVTK